MDSLTTIGHTGGSSSQGDPICNEQHSLLAPLILPHPYSFFQANLAEIHGFWAKLCLDTSVAGANTTIDDVLAAIRTVDQIISDGDQAYWKLRLAYIRLARILASLNPIINRQKRNGHIHARRGHDNSTVKRHLHLKAVEGQTPEAVSGLRSRWGKRLDKMTGGSLFLAVVYSEKAESMMYVSTNFLVTE
ncbi:hypothetical protein J3459_016698 [Metarhizium acridum]|nr:hypothetical protein J3459_016698 [Metarhizium acridum]